MKKHYFFYFAFATLTSFAQCPTGNVTLNSQAEVNNFQSSYPTCTEIMGNLYIMGADITDLTPLSQLTTISGELAIFLCPTITTLNGLQGISSVGTISVGQNQLINDITALSNITTVTNTISMTNCPQLMSLNGLQGITSCGGPCAINSLPVENLSGLDNLASVGFFLEIKNCAHLSNLSALSNLTSISGSLILLNLPVLNDIAGLSNLTPTFTSLSIQNCSSLSFCSISSICLYITTVGSGTFNNNATGCNGGEVVAGCSLATEVFNAESLVLYPNPTCTTLALNIKAQNPEVTITDLTGQIVFFSPAIHSDTIDVTLLAPGVYILFAAANENRFQSKFIKQ